jgi:hypothetical protein
MRRVITDHRHSTIHFANHNAAKRIAKISAPTPIPSKKARNLPFPAWYLPNGAISAAESQLEDASSSCERWAIFCGGIVVISVVGEFILSAVHPAYDSPWEKWGSALADALIALGIVGEVMFGMWNNRIQTELRSRSNKKLGNAEKASGEAKERAANADLARIKLEAQLAPRSLTKEQFDQLQTLRGKVPAVSITSASDFETTRFAAEIALALQIAEVDVKIFPHRVGLVWTNIFIVLPKPSPNVSAEPLYVAFNRAGLSTGCGDRSNAPMADLPPDNSGCNGWCKKCAACGAAVYGGAFYEK